MIEQPCNKLDIDLCVTIAKQTIDSFDYCRTNEELIDFDYYHEQDNDKINFDQVLKEYCTNLVYRLFYEQANAIANDRQALFEPIQTLNSLLNDEYAITPNFELDMNTDYLDRFDNYTEFLDETYDFIYDKIIVYHAVLVYEILSKDEEFKQKIINIILDSK